MLKCELCGNEKDVVQVGSTTYWCKNCLNMGLSEAREMNEIDECADKVEEWINKNNVKLFTTSRVQILLKAGLFKANKVLEKLVERNIIVLNDELMKYEVINKQS